MSAFGFLRQQSESTPHADRLQRPTVLCIGVDFGTSSIKIALREITNAKAPVRFIQFPKVLDGYSRFAFPSVLAIESGRLVCGHDAECAAATGAQAVRSVKRILIGIEPDISPLFDNFEFRFETTARPLASPAEFGAAIMLAAALRTAHVQLAHHIPNFPYATKLYNIDVPVDQLQSSETANVFHRVLAAAIYLSGSEDFDGSPPKLYREWRGFAENWTPGDPRTATTAVIGETQAIMAGVGEAISAREHKGYAVVDVGAGTTDVGVFVYSTYDDSDRINFFAAATRPIGCDDIDTALAASLSSDSSEQAWLRGIIRGAKPTLAAGRTVRAQYGSRIHRIEPTSLDSHVTSLANECHLHYLATWGAAWSKRPGCETLREINMVVVGGGALHRKITEQVATVPRRLNIINKTINLLQLETSGGGEALGDPLPPSKLEQVTLMAARGLSEAPTRLRNLVQPIEIDDIPAQETCGPGELPPEIDLYE